ncbi:integral peroxisomal membrane peroxin-domain-containing protein [Phakopsora pachyrhizi]|uniref:Integral peroxisomal membrane peroxin-domain-containing protein n=1 Tax=Phakopsora pachyrhizi TaxID=170000 RepID=A0AAV0B0I8_PHAPC|nr:integral peroxisomal membrane peroxin-domain-containing protein [Phakopsora pachyrhizi]
MLSPSSSPTTIKSHRSDSTSSSSTLSTRAPQSISKPIDPSVPEQLLALPPPLILLLIHASPLIHHLASLSLILRWEHPLGLWPSWLLILALWSACLFVDTALRLGALNLIIFSLLSYHWFIHPNSPAVRSPHPRDQTFSHNPQTLLHTLQSFHTIADHLSSISLAIRPIRDILHWTDPNLSMLVLQASVVSLPLTLTITRLIPLRYIAAFLGSLFIIWPSDWFLTLRCLLWKSSLIRWSTRLFLSALVGGVKMFFREFHRGSHHDQLIKLWPRQFSTLDFFSKDSSNCLSKGGDLELDGKGLEELSGDNGLKQLEFRFTIYENQRWWMGLDWTSTLLPHERQNWTDHLNRPVPSPSKFNLPAVFNIWDPIKNCQRKVEWQWVDSSWQICKAHPGIDSTGQKDSVKPVSDKLRHRIRARHSNRSNKAQHEDSFGSSSASQPGSPRVDGHPIGESAEQHIDSKELLGGSTMDLYMDDLSQTFSSSGFDLATLDGWDINSAWDVDSQGWQYGDNHWEKLSRKAGIGRYTRRRAWFRRAVMVTSWESEKKENNNKN